MVHSPPREHRNVFAMGAAKVYDVFYHFGVVGHCQTCALLMVPFRLTLQPSVRDALQRMVLNYFLQFNNIGYVAKAPCSLNVHFVNIINHTLLHK